MSAALDAASDLRERASHVLEDLHFCKATQKEQIESWAAEFAAIRAEAESAALELVRNERWTGAYSNGWDDAVKALREIGDAQYKGSFWYPWWGGAADWLASVKPQREK